MRCVYRRVKYSKILIYQLFIQNRFFHYGFHQLIIKNHTYFKSVALAFVAIVYVHFMLVSQKHYLDAALTKMVTKETKLTAHYKKTCE